MLGLPEVCLLLLLLYYSSGENSLSFRQEMLVLIYMEDSVTVETDKGDVPIRKEYFQLWYMQGTPYALYDNYAYVTL